MNGIWHMLRVWTYIYMLTPLLILLLLVKFSNDNLVNSRILNWNEFLMNEMTFLMNERKAFLIKFSTVGICNFNKNKVNFHTYFHFWSPLKTSENQSFSRKQLFTAQKIIFFFRFSSVTIFNFTIVVRIMKHPNQRVEFDQKFCYYSSRQ